MILDLTLTPGAEISGFIRLVSNRDGPLFENEARLPIISTAPTAKDSGYDAGITILLSPGNDSPGI